MGLGFERGCYRHRIAARRAMASKGPNPLIDDPFAEPLVNTVGIDAFIRMINGEVELDDEDPAFTLQGLAEGMAARTRFFDSFFLAAVGDAAGRAPAREGAGQFNTVGDARSRHRCSVVKALDGRPLSSRNRR